MRKISLTLSEEQFKEIRQFADQENTTITDYVIGKLPISQENKLSMKEALHRAETTQHRIFTLADLFEKEEWEGYTNGSRISVGRSFYKITKEKKNSGIKFIGKNSANLAVYEKIRNEN